MTLVGDVAVNMGVILRIYWVYIYDVYGINVGIAMINHPPNHHKWMV